MGNEESISTTGTGLKILTSMKRIAKRHDPSRPVTIPPPPAGDYMGRGGLIVSEVMGYNYADPQAEAWHNNPDPGDGTETSAPSARGASVTDRTKGFVGSYDRHTTTGRASAEGGGGSSAPGPGCRRFRVDEASTTAASRLRISGRTSARMRRDRHLRLPKDTFYYYQSWWTSRPVLHVFPHWVSRGSKAGNRRLGPSNMDHVEVVPNGRALA
jgi:beta-galactosidase